MGISVKRSVIQLILLFGLSTGVQADKYVLDTASTKNIILFEDRFSQLILKQVHVYHAGGNVNSVMGDSWILDVTNNKIGLTYSLPTNIVKDNGYGIHFASYRTQALTSKNTISLPNPEPDMTLTYLPTTNVINNGIALQDLTGTSCTVKSRIQPPLVAYIDCNHGGPIPVSIGMASYWNITNDILDILSLHTEVLVQKAYWEGSVFTNFNTDYIVGSTPSVNLFIQKIRKTLELRTETVIDFGDMYQVGRSSYSEQLLNIKPVVDDLEVNDIPEGIANVQIIALDGSSKCGDLIISSSNDLVLNSSIGGDQTTTHDLSIFNEPLKVKWVSPGNCMSGQVIRTRLFVVDYN